MVSVAHTSRVKRYIDETKGKIVFGGEVDVEKKYVAPTVIRDVPLDDVTMEEYVAKPFYRTNAERGDREIFGPVLPVLPVQDIDEAIQIINTR
jgi:aldehyde dehydrogenase (NAD+)